MTDTQADRVKKILERLYSDGKRAESTHPANINDLHSVSEAQEAIHKELTKARQGWVGANPPQPPSCKHRNIWLISGGHMCWCYECGAVRPNVGGNKEHPIRWQRPSYSKENPAMKDWYPALTWSAGAGRSSAHTKLKREAGGE